MVIEENIIKKVIPQEGYMLTNGEVVAEVIYMKLDAPIDDWWEIPEEEGRMYQDPEFAIEQEIKLARQVKMLEGRVSELEHPEMGMETNPLPYYEGIEVEIGKWYFNGTDISKAIMGGTPNGFNDINYFN